MTARSWTPRCAAFWIVSPTLASVAVVPLGVSRLRNDQTMRAHTRPKQAAVVDLVHSWQADFHACLGKRLVFAADEYYLFRPCLSLTRNAYEGFKLHEDGIGMARTLEAEFNGTTEGITGLPAASLPGLMGPRPRVTGRPGWP